MNKNMSEVVLKNNNTIIKILDLFEKVVMNMANIEKRLIALEVKVND